MNKDEIIIKNCPHVSYTDYGVWACKLYKPMDKNSFVKFGTCGANGTCPYKIAELKTQECEKYIKALEEIELTIKNLEKDDILTFPDFTLQENATIIINQCNQGYRDILDIINKVKGEINE